MTFNDPDQPPNPEAENIALWDPGARTKLFKLIVTWTPKIELRKMPPAPETKTLICRGLDHATEIKDFLAPRNERHLYGPPVQRHAKMAKILGLDDINIFNFYKPVVNIEESTNAARPVPPRLSGGKHVTVTDGEPVGPAPAASGTPVPDGSPGLNVTELLGLGGLLPSGEAELESDGDEAEGGEEDEG